MGWLGSSHMTLDIFLAKNPSRKRFLILQILASQSRKVVLKRMWRVHALPHFGVLTCTIINKGHGVTYLSHELQPSVREATGDSMWITDPLGHPESNSLGVLICCNDWGYGLHTVWKGPVRISGRISITPSMSTTYT